MANIEKDVFEKIEEQLERRDDGVTRVVEAVLGLIGTGLILAWVILTFQLL